MFNTLKAPFDDYRVRQAFFYAIDVDKLISNQMAGHASKVTGFLPKDHKNYHEAKTVYTYDTEKAKKLLEEAGVSDLSFKLLTNNNWVKGLAAQIKNDLEAAGVKCEIQEEKINWSALAESDSVLDYDVMLTPGDPTCFGNDPDLLMSWWYGDNTWTRGRSCWAKAADGKWKELQELMQEAREEADEKAQQELWNQCFDIIAEYPLYPLFHREVATGYWADKMRQASSPSRPRAWSSSTLPLLPTNAEKSSDVLRTRFGAFLFVVETLMCGFHGENLNSMENELSVRA